MFFLSLVPSWPFVVGHLVWTRKWSLPEPQVLQLSGLPLNLERGELRRKKNARKLVAVSPFMLFVLQKPNP
jgi:hypothetical protein